jgi:hypothetical protein
LSARPFFARLATRHDVSAYPAKAIPAARLGDFVMIPITLISNASRKVYRSLVWREMTSEIASATRPLRNSMLQRQLIEERIATQDCYHTESTHLSPSNHNFSHSVLVIS